MWPAAAAMGAMFVGCANKAAMVEPPQAPAITSFAALDEPLVEVVGLDPSIAVDIRYATSNNFVGRPMYSYGRAFLRRDAAERLVRAHESLQPHGLGIKIWDAYRPLSVQWELWEVVPDPQYVADPRRGSRHNRGAAVDVTLVDAEGNELPMPTGYDEFTEAAHRDYMDLDPAIIANRQILEDAMTAQGFTGISSEWWHFDAPGWEEFPLIDIPLGSIVQVVDR
jgi:D-alanyl-D-alanine dipeptidase